MKILKSWLKEYVEIKQSDEELDDLLSFSGTLVESVESGIDSKIIVAEIKEVLPHPNADKLRLARVFDGGGELIVVCGAPNIEAGQKVPLAKVGARIGEIEIKKAEIRGEVSFGMLCSQKELGLGDDHTGIYILPDDYKVGEPLNKYIESDSVFDLEITPNRGDCLSHLGIAREVAALTDQKNKFDPQEYLKLAKPGKGLAIEIQNPEHCFKYSAAVIKNVEIKESPQWLKDRLVALGAKPINNVVDITNYVMLDLGQPLHAFDADKLLPLRQGSGGSSGSQANTDRKIIVRDATEGEEIITLDGVERKLKSGMLVIADEKKAIALAGVMGGENTQIDETTKDIVLESAVFERRVTRKTAKDLQLISEASYRFERGIDSKITEVALLKAAKMVLELTGGELVESVIDTAVEPQNDWIKVEYTKINDLLGTALSDEQINDYLKSLGFEFKEEMVLSPTWRHDVFLWQDLAEEIARLYGFKNIKFEPVEKSAKAEPSFYYYKEHLKDLLVEEGFTEVSTYPFLSEMDLAAAQVKASDLLEVANPVQKENKYMRNSLKPGLLKAIAKNPTFDPVMIFEVGNVFSLDQENTHLGIAISGKGAGKTAEELVEKLAEKIGCAKDLFKLVELNRDELTRFKIKKTNTVICEVDFKPLIEAMKASAVEPSFRHPELDSGSIKYRPVSKFPPVSRDLAFVVSKKISLTEIRNEILEISEKIVLVEPFDEYISDKFGAGKKSVAFHIWLEEKDKTLSDAEADREIKKIIDALKDKFGAELRS